MKTSFFIYVLFSHKDKKLYIGYSTNLESRIQEHVSGKVRSTKNRLSLELICSETYFNLPDAKSREKFLKSGFGRGELKKSLKQTLLDLGYKHIS